MFSVTAFIAIIIWLATFLVVLATRRTPAALCGGMVFGMLFLPHFKIDVPFLDLSKPVLLAFVTAVGVLLVDRSRRPKFRPSILDLPVILLCLAGLGASLSNGLGLYDGLHSATRLFFTWGVPYFIGRAVFSSPDNALTLLRTVILGALIYIPFCALEMKMAPVLHQTIYGYQPRGVNDFRHAVRFGLWRPTVFMSMGLQLSLFMGISSVIAIWGAVSAKLPKVAMFPTYLAASVLAATTAFCVSSGAILLTAAGWGIVLSSRLKLERFLVLAMLLVAAGYPVYRMTHVAAIQLEPTGDDSEVAARMQSLNTRIVSEDLFIQHWSSRPLLGWTPWYFLQADEGRAIPDSMWIIILSQFGLAGWLAWSVMLGIPVFFGTANVRKFQGFQHPAIPMALCLLLFWLDSLMNGFPNIVYGVMIGSVSGMQAIRHGSLPGSVKNYEGSTSNACPRRSLWPPVSPSRQIVLPPHENTSHRL